MDESMKAERASPYAAEAFSLLGISIAVTALRICYRVRVVGIKGLQGDDYFVLVGIIAYTLETCVSYASVIVTGGLANNSMTDEQRARLSPSSEEYRLRVIGSKIHAAGWLSYICSIWSLKAAVCTFYLRLVAGLYKYRRRIMIGFVFIGTGLMVVSLTFFLTCRPFSHLWQVTPDPGIHCQPSVSPGILLTIYVINIVTDFYIIYIPLPMLWTSTLQRRVKIGLCFLFCCAIFIVVAATLRTALVFTHQAESALIAGPWAVRETFVAVIVTNLPVMFPAFKKCIQPMYNSSRRLLSHDGGSHGSSREKDLEGQRHGSGADSRKSQGVRSLYPLTTTTTEGSMGPGFHKTAVPFSRTFEMDPSGSRPQNGTVDNQPVHRTTTSEGRYLEDGDEVALNRHESRGSDGTIAPVPPCKIRKSVEITVRESERASRRLGNFTSAWGPRPKRRGPGSMMNVRTPYLPDYLNLEQFEAEEGHDRNSDTFPGS